MPDVLLRFRTSNPGTRATGESVQLMEQLVFFSDTSCGCESDIMLLVCRMFYTRWNMEFQSYSRKTFLLYNELRSTCVIIQERLDSLCLSQVFQVWDVTTSVCQSSSIWRRNLGDTNLIFLVLHTNIMCFILYMDMIYFMLYVDIICFLLYMDIIWSVSCTDLMCFILYTNIICFWLYVNIICFILRTNTTSLLFLYTEVIYCILYMDIMSYIRT